MPVDILCVGHATYDLCVPVESFPAENSKSETEELLESGGGPAANAAYLLSSWGHRCAFAGLVGDDGHGRRIREEFQAAGTDASLLEVRPGHTTPFSVILVNKQSGSRTVINRKIKNSFLRLEEAALPPLSPRILLFDGHELPASLAALRVFPEAVSVLDAGSWREGTAQLAGLVDYLAASERFAAQACGVPSLESDATRRGCVHDLRQRFSTAVIVTLGEHGLVADDGSGLVSMPAFPARAVDTTAAGDIFHGALVHALAQKLAFRECLRFASMAASLSVRVAGGRKSIPSLECVKEALAHVG
jgi:sulfofructose kinase